MKMYPYNAEDGQTGLMGAAYNGDAEEAARIVTMPCDIDAQDSHGMTAVMYGAMKGHTNVVQLLIEHQVKLELQSAQHFTALMYAVRQNHVETAQEVLRAKAVHGDYDTFDIPLTIAAQSGFFSMVRLLVAAGANVGLHGGYSQLTAECLSRLRGHHEISEFLCYNEKRPWA
jgi:ankyrin repeat protein